jgi:DNA-binding beta-propeller fold protein YncE
MLNARIMSSFQPHKESLDGILWLDGEIWTISGKSSSIIRHREKVGGKLDVLEEIACKLTNPGGIAWDGSGFLVTEKVEKVIYKIDSKNKELKVFLDLTKTKQKAEMQILKAENSKIQDIAFNTCQIWITCQAGFSSSVYCFDSESKELVTRFFARGPKPMGISFEPNGKFAWVLDGSNKELSQFDITGKWTGKALRVPLKKPSGLTIDDKGMFWIADLETKEIYQLNKEA